MKNQAFFTLAVLFSTSFSPWQAFAKQEFHSNSSAREEQTYDSLFPTYAEACSGSQDLPLEGAKGGFIGHEVLYLRGLCRDENSTYPKLRDCTANDKEPGVGISVDEVFKNVNWVAIDSRNFMFRGDLDDNQPLTKEVQEATINKAVARGYFKNIEIDEKDFKGYPAGESKEKWLARESLATSYALNFHRDMLCIRMPLPQNRLERIKDYLNSLNEKYFVGGETYKWNLLTNNCGDVVHNAFAAAGAVNPVRVKAPMPLALVNVISPSNDWAILVQGANRQTNNAWQVYSTGLMRQSLQEDGWLTSQAGGLVEVFPVHSKDNEIADINTQFHMLGVPGVGLFNQLMKHYLKDPTYTDLKTNLFAAKARLDSNLQSRQSLKDVQNLFEQSGREMPKDFPAFYDMYFEALQKQSQQLSEKISRFLADER